MEQNIKLLKKSNSKGELNQKFFGMKEAPPYIVETGHVIHYDVLEQFITTSCVVTSEMICYLFTKNHKNDSWDYVETPSYPFIYQVTFGEFPGDEHVVTVFDNQYIYDSFWKNYSPKWTILEHPMKGKELEQYLKKNFMNCETLNYIEPNTTTSIQQELTQDYINRKFKQQNHSNNFI